MPFISRKRKKTAKSDGEEKKRQQQKLSVNKVVLGKSRSISQFSSESSDKLPLSETNLLSGSNETGEIQTQDMCKLSNWGLPPLVYQKYKARGVSNMFAWQVECLANEKVLKNNRNLVYSAPTSAGKTLVAEILVLKTVLELRKKAIFILPFVSVVREKMYYFQDLLSESGIRVEGFMGNVSPPGGFSSTHLAIATIEKANSIINRLMEDGELSTLGIVVIDELHLLGDPGRGYLLELLLTKLKYTITKTENLKIQLVGMSATLPNLFSLAKWLDAELYNTDFRPIPLAEHCKIGNTIYDSKFEPVRTLPKIPELDSDAEDIIQLCIETIEGGHGILIFCPTKNWCEKLALQIANTFVKLGHSKSSLGQILREKLDSTAIMEILEQLKRCPIGLDRVLKNTVSFGVAFHHAGLTMDERDIIEGAFRAGSLKVLTATSTLSSGVNLPARRVIIRSPMFNRNVLDTLVYRQMIGRAGRMGKDTAGESILICKPNEKSTATLLLSTSLDAIDSCLEGSGKFLRALLEVVASQVVKTCKDLEIYVNCTFAVTCEENNLRGSVNDAIAFLMKNEFLLTEKKELENGETETFLEATPLGKACLAASVSPWDGLALFEELQKARKCFALDTELHILYLVTPYDPKGQIEQIDWIVYLEIWKNMNESEQRVGELVGVEERFLINALRGVVREGKQLKIHRRFFTALALHDLVREVPMAQVCSKYGCNRGLLQSLQQSSATLAGMITQFCKELGWSCIELLVSQFQARLQFGVCRDLLDLLRLPSLNGVRARSFYKEGIKSVADLAVANERDVERALIKAVPFESMKDNENEELKIEDIENRKMKTIFITGMDGLTSQKAASILVQEARNFLKNELGIRDLQWQNDNESDSRMSSMSSMEKSNTSVSLKVTNSEISEELSSNLELDQTKNSERRGSSIISFGTPTKDDSENEKMLETSDVQNTSENIFDSDLERSSFLRKFDSEDFVKNAEERLDSNQEKMRSSLDNNSKENNVESLKLDDDFRIEDVDSSIDSKKGDPENLKVTYSSDFGDIKTGEASVMKGKKRKLEDVTDLKNLKVTKLEESGGKFRNDRDLLNGTQDDITFFDSIENSRVEKPISGFADFKVTKSGSSNSKITDSNPELDQLAGTWDNITLSGINQKRELEESKVQKSRSSYSKVVDLDVFPDNCMGSKNSFRKQPKNNYKSSLTNSDVLPAFLSSEKKSSFDKLEGKFEDFEKGFSIPGTWDSLTFTEDNLKKKSDSGNSKVEKPGSSTSKVMAWSALPTFKNPSKKHDLETSGLLRSKNSVVLPGFFSTGKTSSIEKKKDKSGKSEIDLSIPGTRDDVTFPEDKPGNPTSNPGIPKVEKSKVMDLDASPSVLHAKKNNLGNSNMTGPENSESGSISFKATRSRLKNVDALPGNSRSTSPEDNFFISGTWDSVTFLENNKKEKPENSRLVSKNSKIEKSRTLDSRKNYPAEAENSRPDVGTGSKPKISEVIILDDSPVDTDFIKPNENRCKNSGSEITFPPEAWDSLISLKNNQPEKKPDLKIPEPESLKKQVELPKTNSWESNKISVLREIHSNIIGKTMQDQNLEEMKIVRLENSRESCRLFMEKIEEKPEISMALACEIFAKRDSIGTRILRTGSNEKRQRTSNTFANDGQKMCGVAFSWGIDQVYFLSLEKVPEAPISLKERLNFLGKIFSLEILKVRCFGAKYFYKTLCRCCNITPKCKFLDPKIADWLLNTENTEKSFYIMATEYCPLRNNILRQCETNYCKTSPGLNVKSSIESFKRAIGDAILTWYMMEKLSQKLAGKKGLMESTFQDIEMGIIPILASMELRGIGLNTTALRELSVIMQGEMTRTQDTIFSLAGREFNLCSSKAVSEVLNLPRKGKISTGKSVLAKCENPIANMIVSWRKMSTTQSKIVLPFLHMVDDDYRIRGSCITHSSTGRISMQEPSIQNVPKDFSLYPETATFSVRTAFVPNFGYVFLSADYCQLELRLLAHFSKDPGLCHAICNENGDIFKNIAAKWNRVLLSEVNDEMRQRTKQLCYGMIYGMGTKTLADILKVTEAESTEFLEKFMGTFKGVRKYLGKFIEEARVKGHVTTLMGRRRILPGLFSENRSERSQAERQAVNTKIQGTAADIAKKAMVAVEKKIHELFPGQDQIFSSPRQAKNLRSSEQNGGYLVLQLHDELLYEVKEEQLKVIANLVKTTMEQVVNLSVPLPVKLKTGPTWGDLKDFHEM